MKQLYMDPRTTNKGILFLLFLISPIIPFVYAIRNYKNKNYHVIILMFAFLFGYSFIPYENSDSERYQEFYSTVSTFDFSDFINSLSNIYSAGSIYQDAYLLLLMYLCSIFELSYKAFVGVQAVIYFSLFLSIINIILEVVKQYEIKKYLVFLLGCVFIYSFTAGINNIRFQTAFMVFMFFGLKFVFSGHKKNLFLASLSCLVHMAMAQAFLALILFYFLNKFKNNIVRIISIVAFSLLIFSMNIQEVSQFIGNDIVSQKVGDYTNENYIEGRVNHTQNWNWYIQLNQYSNYYFLILALFLTKFKYRQFKSNETVKRLFLLSLILLVVSSYNELYLDPISNRYRKFFEFVCLVYLVVLFAINSSTIFTKLAKRAYAIVLLLSILISLRSISYNLDVIRLTLSPLINLMEFESVNMYNLI